MEPFNPVRPTEPTPASQASSGSSIQKVAKALLDKGLVSILYECKTCDEINGNTDLEKAAAHFESQNRGRPRDSQWRHELSQKVRLVTLSAPAETDVPGIINGKINMELSDHADQEHPKCPACKTGSLLTTRTNTRIDRDGDTEVTGWEVVCLNCSLTGTLHND